MLQRTRDTITRHNRVRNLLFQLAEVGMLTPELEKLGILGPTDRSRRRPGDVSFKNWGPNRGLAWLSFVLWQPLTWIVRNLVSRMQGTKSCTLRCWVRWFRLRLRAHGVRDEWSPEREGLCILKLIRFASLRSQFVCWSGVGEDLMVHSDLCGAVDPEPRV